MQTTTATYELRDTDTIVGEIPSNYILRVRDLPGADKPREKLVEYGPGNVSLAELLAIIWGTGTKKEEVMSMSHRILKEYGEKAIVHEKDPARLSENLDIPLTKACQLIASFELGRRFFARRGNNPAYIRNADQAFAYCRGMGGSQKEQLRGLYLNSRYEVIHDEVISVGSLTANIVHPREVFAPALAHGAVAVIIAHNHPSGDTTPTTADIEVTRQLKASGQILGIDLLDHLVIGENSYASIQGDAL